ncbi:MAG: TolC family protein [Deltaproteobacteria bacterium]|nr:TolC family protein [Deltaproteobacteria bacterium]
MKITQQLLGCFLILALVTPVAALAEKVNLRLDEIVSLAQKNNPQIDVARQQCLQNQGVLTQAKSGYLPHLFVGGSAARQNIDNLEPDDEDSVYNASVRASQLIYDFGNTGGAIESSRLSLQASDDIFYQTRQDIVFTSKQAFYDVLAKKRLVEVDKEAVSNFEQQLYRAKKYFDAGVRTKIDVTNAGVELSNSKLSLLRSKSNVKTARVKFEQVLGIRPNNGNYRLTHIDVSLAKLAENKPDMPGSLDGQLDTAFDHRSDVMAVKSLVQASKAEIRKARSGYFPSVSANAGYDEYDTDLESISDQWRFGVDLTWELFSGFQTEGEIVSAKGKFQELKAALRDLELAVRQEVTDSYLRANENREGVDIAHETLILAKENFYMASERYKAGLNDMIEYNDAQLLLSRAQSNLIITYYDYLTALARLERAVGVTPELEQRDGEGRQPCTTITN